MSLDKMPNASLDKTPNVISKSGTGTVVGGDTTVTITHDKGSVPTVVSLVPVDDLEGRGYWVTSLTATTFIINISTPSPGVDHSFLWGC